MILDRSASRRTIATTQDQVAVLKANLDNQTGESLGYGTPQSDCLKPAHWMSS